MPDAPEFLCSFVRMALSAIRLGHASIYKMRLSLTAKIVHAELM